MHEEYAPPAVAKLVNGKWLSRAGDEGIKHLALDSRKINEPADTLFFAIVGKRHNGHDYINEAYEKGIRNFIVSEERDYSRMFDANIIQVKSAVAALQTLATHHRSKFNIPIIGITGSNGKTIVKEWLYQLLNEDHQIVRSPRSYNSQVGVPLSVWQMDAADTLGIFEAGISEAGEMEHLERIIRPEIGIFTNIGTAHAEGFLNDRHKIKEKLKLFINCKALIYCSDYQEITQAISEYRQLFNTEEDQLTRFKVFTWSQRQDADLRITNIEKNLNHARISGNYKGTVVHIEVPFSDDASIENVIQCWLTLLYLGTETDVIAARIAKLGKIAMRLELKNAINGSSLINDSYNSDIGSLGIALDFLNQQKQHNRKTVILSDILQSGKSADELYGQVAQMLSKHGVDRLIGIGKAITAQRAKFETNGRELNLFDDTDSFLQALPDVSFRNETILLKGARHFEFERISKLLEQKVHETVLEINLDAVANNLQVYTSLLKPGTKMMVMVKALSYGSGSHEIASTLQFHRADYLAVAYADEGIALRQAGVSLPVMVMNPEQYSFEGLVQHQLEPDLYSLGITKKFLLALQELKLDGPYPVHIELDTGMKRLGFDAADIKELNKLLLDNKDKLLVRSVFTHLAGSEVPAHDDFTREQVARFEKMYDQLSADIGEKPLRHVVNTAGIVRHEAAHFDMVRLGLGLYGVDTTGRLKGRLKPVGRLKTTISQIKSIQRGETIGYGRAGRGELVQRIATVGIGYADGIDRRLSNGVGKMLVHGKLAPIVGNVCMDMCMLDVSAIPEARESDEVIIFGPELPVEKLADWMGTIPYEILTKVSDRVKRIYYHE